MKTMRVWRNSPLDAILVVLSATHLGAIIVLASVWDETGAWWQVGSYLLLIFMMIYNVIIVSHLFTHQPWFRSAVLNGAISMINSASIAQSVQAYELSHVRNHHRYNNDRKQVDGSTKDRSSTFRDGEGDNHTRLLRYIFAGAVATIVDMGQALLSIRRLFRVGKGESELLELVSRRPTVRARELRQVQRDRLAFFLFLTLLVALSWRWTLLCYVPSVFVALMLINVQNYYRHYGAIPENRYADSVSHYGRIYNLLAFNDGYHQEHHLRPGTHWSRLPAVGDRYRHELDEANRLISPVPAIVGFLDRVRSRATT